ncbi:pseudouridine synthase [Zymomonas mobilis]|uniref:pseudouridine synthase n=1 Tax=Zymomonas mobilis TaxID=542 RepID=UPI0039EBB48B
MVFNRPPKSGKGRSPSSRNPARSQTTSENNRSQKTLRPSFDKKKEDNTSFRHFDSSARKDKPYKKAAGYSDNTSRQDRAPLKARQDRQENDRFSRHNRPDSNDRFQRNNQRQDFSERPRSFRDQKPAQGRYSGDRKTDNSYGYRKEAGDRFSRNDYPRTDSPRGERPFPNRKGEMRNNENRPSRFSRGPSDRSDRFSRNAGYKNIRSDNRFSENASRNYGYAGERNDRRSERQGYNRNLAVNPSYSPNARPFRKKGASEPASARIPREHGEQRIAKLLSRAGIASRRMIEAMIEEGRIAIDGVTVEKPATLLTSLDGVTVDGKPVNAPTETRLFLYHKATGLLTTERDPEGRKTIYDRLPADLPRVMPVGRLDMNTEGLLLLTTDGGFKRMLELPATHIERCYRARVFGDVSQDQLEELIEGVTIDGIHYGSIDANLERRTGRNGWVEMKLHEGRNREVRRVLGYLGLQVSRLIRISYGPFLLGDLPVGAVEEVDPATLKAFKNTLPEMS